jgi:PHD/YefM family antitoxin component YafN of YafNO toxin-antitoxin module
MSIFPQTVSVKNIQKDYRKIFDSVKKTREPVIVLRNNEPDVAIVNMKELELLYEVRRRTEERQALKAVREYKRLKKAGKLKTLSSLKDLM